MDWIRLGSKLSREGIQFIGIKYVVTFCRISFNTAEITAF